MKQWMRNIASRYATYVDSHPALDVSLVVIYVLAMLFLCALVVAMDFKLHWYFIVPFMLLCCVVIVRECWREIKALYHRQFENKGSESDE